MAPSAVVYGAFVTESCALLLRICKLLLRYLFHIFHFKKIISLSSYFHTFIINLTYYSYRAMCPQLQQILPAELYEERILDISVYANNIHKALWLDKVCIIRILILIILNKFNKYYKFLTISKNCLKPFSARENSNFLRNLSKEVINDLTDCDLDSLLNISCHYAILPYKCTLNYMLNKAGLHISTKEVCFKYLL